jgi:hypothetical protein
MHYIGQSLVTIDHEGCKLKWTASTASDLDGYYVYMSEYNDQSFKRMTPQAVTESEWISPPLRTDSKYFFYITAVDSSGNESSPSGVIEYVRPDGVVDSQLLIVDPPTDYTVYSGGLKDESTPGKDFMTHFTYGGTV